MLDTLESRKIKVLLAGMRVLKSSGKDYEHKFAAIYPRMAKKHNLTLMPFFLEGVAGKRELNQHDENQNNESN